MTILRHGKRKQQPFTAGSSIHVAGSAQIQHDKQEHKPEIEKPRDNVYVSPQLKRPLLPASVGPLVDVLDSIKSNFELCRGKLRSFKTSKRSIQDFPKQGMEQFFTLEQAKNPKNNEGYYRNRWVIHSQSWPKETSNHNSITKLVVLHRNCQTIQPTVN